MSLRAAETNSLLNEVKGLRADFQEMSEKCAERIGQTECALQAAAIWEQAAKRLGKVIKEWQGHE